MNKRITFEGIEWEDFELAQPLPTSVNIDLSAEQWDAFNSRDVAPGPWQALVELIWNRLEGIFDCDLIRFDGVRVASKVEGSLGFPTFEV